MVLIDRLLPQGTAEAQAACASVTGAAPSGVTALSIDDASDCTLAGVRVQLSSAAPDVATRTALQRLDRLLLGIHLARNLFQASASAVPSKGRRRDCRPLTSYMRASYLSLVAGKRPHVCRVDDRHGGPAIRLSTAAQHG